MKMIHRYSHLRKRRGSFSLTAAKRSSQLPFVRLGSKSSHSMMRSLPLVSEAHLPQAHCSAHVLPSPRS